MQPKTTFNRRKLLQAGAVVIAPNILKSVSAQNSAQLNMAKIVLGAPAGTLMDLFVRRIADSIQPAYARSVIVDNRVGASGQISISAVKNAAPDGSTVLEVPGPNMSLYPYVYSKLPYDPVADFVPVTLGALIDSAIAVGPMVPLDVRTIPEFFIWCKANPGKANFGSPAVASSLHFAGSIAARAAGVEFTHVPYRGTTPAILEMISGQLAAVCAPIGDYTPFFDPVKCRLLGTTGVKRSRFAPNVPTLVEQGYKEAFLSDWFGFFLPKGTPATHVNRLNASIKAALQNPVVVKALEDRCLEPVWCTPDELATRLASDMARWRTITQTLNFKVES